MNTMNTVNKSVNLNSKLSDGSKKKYGQNAVQNAFKYEHPKRVCSGWSAVKRSKWCWCSQFVFIVGWLLFIVVG